MEAAADRWCHPGVTREVPEVEWPPELRRLRPAKAVRASADGLFVPLRSFFVEEWGLFVLPAASGCRPSPAGDPSFRPLRGRVYRYYIAG